MKGSLIKKMAEVEYRLSKGCEDEIQLAALIGAFFIARQVNN